ncbi:mCG1042584, partial [Mus musculus]
QQIPENQGEKMKARFIFFHIGTKVLLRKPRFGMTVDCAELWQYLCPWNPRSALDVMTSSIIPAFLGESGGTDRRGAWHLAG